MVKNNTQKDITFDYFENYVIVEEKINDEKIILSYDDREPQFYNYSKHNFNIIKKLYFSNKINRLLLNKNPIKVY